ncbi:hypothetical protein [Bradyrhizobium sp. WSM3983]|uniref:hypothetical protein n=1 Tax=Bradyrhizobium sp. WSM3983 TaxID=1038867 RepID=UPI000418946B|nr:hypothetical protein [Bradyrhizobium sp. WSM3983]
MARISVKKDPAQPERKEVLAEAIVRIGEALESLKKSGLNEHAIVVLLHHETKISMRDIRVVFAGLRQLRGRYCR